MRGDEVLLHIAGSLDFAGELGAFFGDLALIAEEEGEQGKEDAGGGEAAGAQQKEDPARKIVGDAGKRDAGDFNGKPDKVGCAPEDAERGERADAAGKGLVRPEDDEGHKRDEHVRNKLGWTQHSPVEGCDPGGLIGGHEYIDGSWEVAERDEYEQYDHGGGHAPARDSIEKGSLGNGQSNVTCKRDEEA